MFLAIAVILALLWAFGLLTGTTIGGLLHLLLVLAIIAILVQLLSGRRIA